MAQLRATSITGNLYVTGDISSNGKVILSSISNISDGSKTLSDYLSAKQSTLILDDSPTENSINFCTSGAIFSYINKAITAVINSEY